MKKTAPAEKEDEPMIVVNALGEQCPIPVVKATPTPAILKILKEEGCGCDCSSEAELVMAERCGVTGEGIMFSSNDTPAEEFRLADRLGAIINLDDLTMVDYL